MCNNLFFLIFHYYNIILISDHLEIYIFSLGISLSYLFVTVSELIFCEIFETFLILAENFITNRITSCFYGFLNYSFWSSFKCVCCRLFSMMNKFVAIFTTQDFAYIFTNILPIFLAKDKNPKSFTNIWFLNWTE